MASEISKLRRKRTNKRNSENSLLEEADGLLNDTERSTDELKIELSSRRDTLVDLNSIVKLLDDKIADLIEEDADAEKDEKDAVKQNIKVDVCIKKIDSFLRQQEKDEYRTAFGNINPLNLSRTFDSQTGTWTIQTRLLKQGHGLFFK